MPRRRAGTATSARHITTCLAACPERIDAMAIKAIETLLGTAQLPGQPSRSRAADMMGCDATCMPLHFAMSITARLQVIASLAQSAARARTFISRAAALHADTAHFLTRQGRHGCAFPAHIHTRHAALMTGRDGLIYRFHSAESHPLHATAYKSITVSRQEARGWQTPDAGHQCAFRKSITPIYRAFSLLKILPCHH